MISTLRSALLALTAAYAFSATSAAPAAAQTTKRQCVNACRTRYRDCLALRQIPSFECRGIYQDCTNYSCKAGSAGRPSWSGFPS